MDDSDLREQAKARLESKQKFWKTLVIFVVVNAFLVAIWATNTPRGSFWPIWPILGMGIAVAFSAWEAFGGGTITEKDIEAEMRKMKGDSAGEK